MMSFDNLGLRADLLGRLEATEKTQATPIQSEAIPEILKCRDVMGLAQTGTGKTLAFGLPIIHQLLNAGEPCTPHTTHALILAPTRELAAQIHESLATLCKGLSMRLRLVVGGVSINPQIKKLEGGMHILVATPGRLLDLIDQKALRLDQVRHLVLDEADQMLDLGFIHALRRIAKLVPRERQTLLFSATMPNQMAEIAGAFLTDPVRIQVASPGKTADRIDQSVIFAENNAKPDVLARLLGDHRDDLALVFARTKHGSDKLAKRLEQAGYKVAAIHGNKSQNQRTRALESFRSGELKVLVATDVAARGIDIPDVRHVYNYEMPNVPDTYVHRIGRTARAGRDGRAVSLCSAEEVADLKAIEKLIGNRIRVAGGEQPPAAVAAAANAAARQARGSRGGRGGDKAGAVGAFKDRGERSGAGKSGGAGRGGPASKGAAGKPSGASKPKSGAPRRRSGARQG